jgi:histidinol phosphatase-like enzyme (inositol monophosphatase family)
MRVAAEASGHNRVMTFEKERALAEAVAREAGALALDFQRRGVAAEQKEDESPVTAADRACEKLIVERILAAFPDDGLLGEEGSSRASQNGRKWIIDPIDGTRDYVRGIPLWAVLIGFEQDGEVVAGAAFNPCQDLMLSAAKGQGTTANGERVHVSTKAAPEEAVLCFNGFNKVGVESYAHTLLPWVRRFWAVRGLGGSVDAMLVAQGKADVWIEPSAKPWDFAALKIVIEEAGGRFCSLDGESTIYGGNAYACAPGLEPYVRELIGRR